jgi:zinc transporter ZupT
MSNGWLLLLAIGAALLSLVTSYYVARSGYYSRSQVVAQIAIIWLVPLLGAIFVYLIMSSNRPNQRREVGADSHNWQNAEDVSHVDPHAP